MNKSHVEYYNRVVEPVLKTSQKVIISDEMILKIKEHAKKRTEYKKREFDHVIDNDREEERLVTGLMGEAAVEKLFGVDIIDWTIGDSKKYNVPDIKGYNVGIKTVERGKFPIIFKSNKYPQLFCVRDTMHPNLVCVCGVAEVGTLNKYQSDDLILNWKLRSKGYKTGFYGFDHLVEVKTLNDLRTKVKSV